MSNDIKQSFERRIQQSINQINELRSDDKADEIIANLAKYLCILISGYTEKVFIHLIVQHFSVRANPKIVRFISQTYRHATNLNMEKMLDILQKFDDNWKDTILNHLQYDEYSSSIQAIYDNRNKIAHGENVNVTVTNLETWYHSIQDFFAYINRLINGS